MATQINQIDDPERRETIFRIEGEMFRADAELIGRIAADAHAASGHKIKIDLADLDFLDSESAGVLRKLGDDLVVEIIGTEIFLQSSVDKAERR
ncbi:MAG: STAS domain-containing protein [Pyrinomonadaceae bacterium]